MANTTITKSIAPTRYRIEVMESDIIRLVPEGNLFTFRTQALDFDRWTIIDLGVSLPSNPRTVFVQTKFPPNTDLPNVSDNFSTLVTVATSSLITVNVWRVDRAENPSLNFALDVLIII